MAKKICFKGFDPESHPAPNRYRGPSGEWAKGEVKSVEDKEAERLLADFPTAFLPAR